MNLQECTDLKTISLELSAKGPVLRLDWSNDRQYRIKLLSLTPTGVSLGLTEAIVLIHRESKNSKLNK